MTTRTILALAFCSMFGRLAAEDLTVWVWTKNVEQPAVFNMKLPQKGPAKQMQGDFHKISFPIMVEASDDRPEIMDYKSMDVFTGLTIVAEFCRSGIGVTLEYSSLVDDSGRQSSGAKNLLLRSMEFIAPHMVGEQRASEREVVMTSPDHPVIEKVEYQVNGLKEVTF